MPTDEEQESLQPGEITLDDDIALDPDDQDTDDTDSQEDDEGSVEGKRVKDAQAKMHEATRRAAELEKAVEKLTGQVSTLTEIAAGRTSQQQPQAPENPFEFLDDPTVKESLLDSSDNVVGVIKRAVAEIGRTMHLRDQMFLGELNKRDPSVQSVRQEIEKFRGENPDLADLPDAKIAVILKKMTKPSEGPQKKRVLAIGSRPESTTDEDSEKKKAVDFWYNKIGYNLQDELEKRRARK